MEHCVRRPAWEESGMTGEAQQLLQAIADRNGGHISPQIVIDAARDPDSPLHPYFTWDDVEAAEKQRLHEARTLIRSVRVEVVRGNQVIAAPFYVRDPARAAQEQGYVSVPILRTREDAARDAVIAEFKRAASALDRARNIAVALDLSGESETIQGQVLSLAASIDARR